jgi:hypothetical protein
MFTTPQSKAKLLLGLGALFLLLGVGHVLLQYVGGQRMHSAKVFTDQDLLGNWQMTIPNDDPACKAGHNPDCVPTTVVEISFESGKGGHAFNSWLHSRPEFSNCSWSLSSTTLHVVCDKSGGSSNEAFMVIDNDTIVLTGGIYAGKFTRYKGID